MNNSEPTIMISLDGPIGVSGGVPLVERYPAKSVNGEPLAWDPVGADQVEPPVREFYCLCRCGRSTDKPYCDGTHREVEFNRELTADRAPGATRRVTFTGEGVVMTDDPSLCMEAGFCGTRFAKVWDMIHRTGDPEVRARLREMAVNCPSGRLEVTITGESRPAEPEFRPSIAVIPDGPLWVRGGLRIEAPDGFVYEVRNRVTLCRCGQSRNMPFCDGTHEQVGFRAPGLGDLD